MAAVNAALELARTSWDLVADSIVGVNRRAEEASTAFREYTGNAQAAGQMLQFLQREAERTTFPGAELIQAGQQLIPVVRGDQQAFEGLIHTAEVLAALRPQEGIVSATDALRRVSQGDLEAIQRRFGLNADAIRAWMAQGVPAIEAVDRELQRMGADQRLVEGMTRTFGGMAGAIDSFRTRVRGELGAGLFHDMEEGLRHVTDLIDRYGQGVEAFATALGAAIGGVLSQVMGGLFSFLRDAAVALAGFVDQFAPGFQQRVREFFDTATRGAGQTKQATDGAAQSAERLAQVFTLAEVQQGLKDAGTDVQALNAVLAETSRPLQQNARELAVLGLHAAGLQQQADRVQRAYADQLYPLQRQQQLLQQNVTLQRLQSDLAGTQAREQRTRLELEIAALDAATQGRLDPNDPSLDARQRAIALARQEREEQLGILNIQEQQRPEQESLTERIQALQRAQEDALRPLEVALQNDKERVATLQLERDQWNLEVMDIQAAIDKALTLQNAMKPPPGNTAAWQQDGEAAGTAWAQGVADGWKAWWDVHGDQTFDHAALDLLLWAQKTGVPLAVRVGGLLGEALARAFTEPVRAALTTVLTAFLPEAKAKEVEAALEPVVGRLVRGQAPFAPIAVTFPGAAPPPSVQQGVSAQVAQGGAGPTVNLTVAQGAVTVNGQTDDARTQALQQAAQEALQPLIDHMTAAAAAADAESAARLQGGGR
jgi:hypothetical protein